MSDHDQTWPPGRIRQVAVLRVRSLVGLVLIAALVSGCGDSDDADPRDGQVDLDAQVSLDAISADRDTMDAAEPLVDAAVGTDGAQPQDGSTPGPDAQADAAAPGLRDDGLPAPGWPEQVAAVANRSALTTAFASAAYSPPADARVFAARLQDGVGQPAFRYYSLGDTGFDYSAGSYWPASTVKLTAAVAALDTLDGHGLTGAAQVAFTDDDGTYDGTVANLYDLALSVSDNVAYNRLMEIAGFDEINDQLLTAANGLPEMVLQRRYTHPTPSSDLRTSPAIAWSEGSAAGTLPQRIGTGQHPECPNEGNCITLAELLDVMRRVTLHDELPLLHRFALASADVAGLMQALADSPTYLDTGSAAALGHAVTVFNKTGWVPSNERLDHGLVVDDVTGDRYLIALSLPDAGTTAADLSSLAEEVVRALVSGPGEGPALQLDAGIPITVQLDDLGTSTSPPAHDYRLWVDAPGADEVRIWADRWSLPPVDPPAVNGTAYHRLDYAFSTLGTRLLVVQALSGGQIIGSRVLTVVIQ